MTFRSSSVVVSPLTSPPAAISFSRRRMIFPLRVLGRASVKRMSSGLAMRADLRGDVGAEFFLQRGRGFDAAAQR